MKRYSKARNNTIKKSSKSSVYGTKKLPSYSARPASKKAFMGLAKKIKKIFT
jgi:hypothetical protein